MAVPIPYYDTNIFIQYILLRYIDSLAYWVEYVRQLPRKNVEEN